MNRDAMAEAWLAGCVAIDDAYEALTKDDRECDCGTCAYCDDSDPGCER